MGNKIALITGATDGIGKAVALKLLAEGWEVVSNGRNANKCRIAINELKEKSGNNNVSSFIADLSNLAEVKNATENFLATYNRLDFLMLNANEPQPMRTFVKLMNIIVGITAEQAAENIFIVMNDIVSNKKKGTCYAWKKERALPKIKTIQENNEKLIKLTDELSQNY